MPDLGLVALSFFVVAIGFHVVISRDLEADRAAVNARKAPYGGTAKQGGARRERDSVHACK